MRLYFPPPGCASPFSNCQPSHSGYRTIALVTVVLSLLHSGVAFSDDADFDRTRQGYAKTMKSLKTVLCKFEWEFIPPSEKFLDIPRKRTWQWANDGSRWNLSSEPTVSPGGSQYKPSFRSFDGQSQWKVDHYHSNVRKRSKEISNADLLIQESPGRILGLYFNIGKYQVPDVTLQTILEKHSPKLAGKETIDGHECWRVEFKYPGREAKRDLPMTIWLDPAEGFLPRRLNDFVGQTTTVKEFQKFPLGESREMVSFPVQIWFESATLGDRRLTVTNVTLNSKLEPKLFRPDIPRGYKLYNLDDERQLAALRGQKREMEVRKNKNRKQSSSQNSVGSVDQNLAGSGVIDARPQRPGYMLIILAIGGLLICVVCGVALIKTRWQR